MRKLSDLVAVMNYAEREIRQLIGMEVRTEYGRCLRVLALSGHLSRKAGFTLYFNMGIFSDGPLKGASSRSSESPAWTIWCIYLILSG
jgi:hypothetical protein